MFAEHVVYCRRTDRHDDPVYWLTVSHDHGATVEATKDASAW